MRRWLLGFPVFETIFAIIALLIVLLPIIAWIRGAFGK
jgi:hypothetical protein